MKFTLSWLRDYLDTQSSLQEITTTLVSLGLEVESVVPGEVLAPFVTALVEEVRPHPNADRLRLCTVYDGQTRRQVVCGAPNVRERLVGVLARPGVSLPGQEGLTLKKSVIRGETSEGMLCSAQELGLTGDHEGILDMGEVQPGRSLTEVLDPVVDLAITPNRGDCFGVAGLARDLAAAGLGRTRSPSERWASVEGTFPCPWTWNVKDEDCSFITGRLIRGVNPHQESPTWLQARLRALGVRPQGALVDVGTYVMFDTGHPVHIYDARTLQGQALDVRRAQTGESFKALNGTTYTLEESMLSVADGQGVVGLAGLMGGQESACSENTTDVFLEAGVFSALSLAQTGRALGLHTEARHRFERGVDPCTAPVALAAVTALIQEVCGGEASHVVSAPSPSPLPEKRYAVLREESFSRLTGLSLPLERMAHTLTKLGFVPHVEDHHLRAQIPSWRSDVHGERGLIEEVVRLHGVDSLPSVPFTSPSPSKLPLKHACFAELRRGLAARGLWEALSYPFVGEASLGFSKTPLKLANPVNQDEPFLRTSLLASLLPALQRNKRMGCESVSLFEVGPVFVPEQQEMVSGVRWGHAPAHWSEPERSWDVFDVKGDALTALALCGLNTKGLKVRPEGPSYYHPGRSGTFMQGTSPRAFFGQLHPALSRGYGFKTGAVYAFETLLEGMFQKKKRTLLRLSPFQAVHRDFCFTVPASCSAQDLLRATRVDSLIETVNVIDVYQRPEGKSITLRVTLQPQKGTLKEEDLQRLSEALCERVRAKTGGLLRSPLEASAKEG